MMNFSLPSPPLIIKFFLYLTLFIHLLLVNLVLGSSFLIATYLIKGKEKHLNIAKPMAGRLPYFMAFLITFGVAPLLFIQTLYPSLFYNALINFSIPSFLVLISVFFSYTLLYIGARNWEKLKVYKIFLYSFVGILLTFVMFVFNNIMSFIEEAKENPSLFLNNEYGFDFYFSSPTLLARFFHFFFSSIAISGLWVAIWGVIKLPKDPEQGRWQYRSGATYFSSSTILVIVTGVWWLLVVSKDASSLIMGKSILHTIIFIMLIVSSLTALILALLGMNSIKPSVFLRITGVLTVFNVFAMIFLRDSFRTAQLKEFAEFSQTPSNFQWIAFLLFVFFLIFAGLVVYDTIKRIKTNLRKQ
ncbi:MAG: hypothetical protein N2445_06060 [Acidobacteria bacterium]|nr:hypothetical protein [Acidobacteriota bacterium]